MIIRNAFHIILILFATLTFSQNANAQNHSDKIQSLGDILNEPNDYGNNGQPLTSAIMANNYYKKCISKESLVFKEKELKILCGCNSAKMSELLTVSEFKLLNENSKQGKNTRGKMLAHAYAPCMEYVIESKVNRDCRRSRALESIIIGKKAICKCVTNEFKKFVNKNASFIIMGAIHHNPMTLNPLEEFYLGSNYHAQRDHFARQCRFDFQFKKNNR